MKINPINNQTFNIQYFGTKSVQQKADSKPQVSLNNSLPNPISGSFISFTGYDPAKNDRKFIYAVSQTLRLSPDETKKFKEIVNSFLAETDINDLGVLADEYYTDEDIAVLLDNIDNGLSLSDMDSDIMLNMLFDRIYADEFSYNPKADKYIKDFEVVDHILDKYKFDKPQKAELYNFLKYDAENNGYKNVFEIFNRKDKLKYSSTVSYINKNFDEDQALDMMIEFTKFAKKDQKARHSEINPHKISTILNEQTKDYVIASEITNACCLPEDELKYISKELNKRREGENIDKIAYELTERYNLPVSAYKYIVNIVNSYDTEGMRPELM